MVSTRRSALAVPERSVLQLERDGVASQMDFSWPSIGPNRINEESRGIENDGNTCYQNSIMQTLLHQPPFMRWMFTHLDTRKNPCDIDECLKCFVRQLIEEYWGHQNPAIEVTYTDNDSENINIEACNSGLFTTFSQEDAILFFNWLQDALHTIPTLETIQDLRSPEGFTKRQRRDQLADLRRRNQPFLDWQKQHDTLYRLDLQCTDTCQTCGFVHQPCEDSRMFSVPVHPAFTTIYEAIASAFTETITDIRCDRCKANRTKDRVRHILAAPKILAVHLQILSHTGKIFHTLTYPQHLDLTARQTHTTLPLRYKLMGVVAHGGTGINAGHYIASVRGRDPTNFMCISDDIREDFSLQEFMANPQRPTNEEIWDPPEGYQVYMLMYERDDRGRSMPTAQGKMSRELRNLGLV